MVAQALERAARTPDLVEEHLQWDGPIRVSSENDEQHELLARQIDWLASDERLVSIQVDQQATDFERIEVDRF